MRTITPKPKSAKVRILTEAKLQLLAKKILKMKMIDEPKATLDIFLLPNAAIKTLKARFIKKQTEPNVLAFPEPIAFPHPETKPGQKYLGEIYLNRDILQRIPARTAPLLLHGILHLLGYDHKKNVDAKEMEPLEEKILAKLKK
jgi:probable rRNA maturation factor